MLISGAKALIASSKRIWSLPLPVAPWQIATAFSLRAISTSFFIFFHFSLAFSIYMMYIMPCKIHLNLILSR